MSKKALKKDHTAKFLMKKFLYSPASFQLGINSADFAILTVCADLIDQQHKEGHSEKKVRTYVLYGFQETIAHRARVRREVVNRKFKFYVEAKIFLQLSKFRGRSNKFRLGELIIDSSDFKSLEMENKNKKNNTSDLESQASDLESQASDLESHILEEELCIISKALTTLGNENVVNFEKYNEEQKKNSEEALRKMAKKLNREKDLKI